MFTGPSTSETGRQGEERRLWSPVARRAAPPGSPGALQTLLMPPLLSTQLTCASLTGAGLLMATAS